MYKREVVVAGVVVCLLFVFAAAAAAEIYTGWIVGGVRCV